MNKKAEYGATAFFLTLIIIGLTSFIGWWMITGKTIGNFVDSDNDGLSDKEELKIGTDPKKSNTDSDRYLDGDDNEPLKKNSANITIYLYDKSWNWGSGIVNIGLAFLKINPGPETVIADADVILLIENNGDDYTNFVNYDVIYEVSNHEVGFIKDSIGKLNKGEKITKKYHKTILLKEVPDLVWNAITEWNVEWQIKIDNLNYEQYT